MSSTVEHAFTQKTAALFIGAGLPYNVMSDSPCKCRPDTGCECHRIDLPKNEGECLSCALIGNVEQRLYSAKYQRAPYGKAGTRDRVKRREVAWRNRYGTEPPDEYLHQAPKSRRTIYGKCNMDGCEKDASRRVLDMKFCLSHSSTARNRIERGKTTVEDITCKPKQSPYIQVRK